MSSPSPETFPQRVPYLAKGHEILFYVRSLHMFRRLAVISDDNGHCGVKLADAINQRSQLIIAEESLGGYGDQGTDIVFCCGERVLNKLAKH